MKEGERLGLVMTAHLFSIRPHWFCVIRICVQLWCGDGKRRGRLSEVVQSEREREKAVYVPQRSVSQIVPGPISWRLLVDEARVKEPRIWP